MWKLEKQVRINLNVVRNTDNNNNNNSNIVIKSFSNSGDIGHGRLDSIRKNPQVTRAPPPPPPVRASLLPPIMSNNNAITTTQAATRTASNQNTESAWQQQQAASQHEINVQFTCHRLNEHEQLVSGYCGECDSCEIVSRLGELKQWFDRASHSTQKKLLVGLLSRIRSVKAYEYLNDVLQPLANYSKDFIYSRNKYLPSLDQDTLKVTNDR